MMYHSISTYERKMQSNIVDPIEIVAYVNAKANLSFLLARK